MLTIGNKVRTKQIENFVAVDRDGVIQFKGTSQGAVNRIRQNGGDAGGWFKAKSDKNVGDRFLDQATLVNARQRAFA